MNLREFPIEFREPDGFDLDLDADHRHLRGIGNRPPPPAPARDGRDDALQQLQGRDQCPLRLGESPEREPQDHRAPRKARPGRRRRHRLRSRAELEGAGRLA